MAGESDITQKTLLICKGQELTMSPTQGQADNIERTIPYQPFRCPQGDSCMAGYLCPMTTASSNYIIFANGPYLMHLAPFCWQSLSDAAGIILSILGIPNVILFYHFLLLLGITNARARHTRISNSGERKFVK